jgi:hypothetical protein
VPQPLEYLTLSQASVIFEVEHADLVELISRLGIKGEVYMGRPINPAGVGRPVVVYARDELERALEQDAARRLEKPA